MDQKVQMVLIEELEEAVPVVLGAVLELFQDLVQEELEHHIQEVPVVVLEIKDMELMEAQ